MISDTISILTDSTLIETVHLIANDTLVIQIQHCSIPSTEQSSILNYVLKNGITILLALVAGFIALIQVKSNVISTARIKRMDELRINLSEFCNSAMDTPINYINQIKHAKENEFDDYEKYLSSHAQFTILTCKISLLLDSENSIHSQIEDLIEEISIMMDRNHIHTTKQEDISVMLNQIIELSKEVFKQEWKRSKRIWKL